MSPRVFPWLLPAVGLGAIGAMAAVEPRYLSFENLVNVARQTAPLALFSMAQTVPLLTRGLDLSQGGVVVMTSVTAALLSTVVGTPVGMLLALAVGVLSGLLCGTLVAYLKASALVVSLGVGSMLSGLALLASNGQPVSNVGAGFSGIFYWSPGGLPFPIVLVGLVAGVLTFVLNRTATGRFIRAVGSSERAALMSGVPVPRSLILAYVISGLMTSMGGVLLAARISSGHPTVGGDTALQAIAAAVIGGVSLLGGRGSIAGALLGAVFMGLLANALNILGISSFSQIILIGMAIVGAVVLDRARSSRVN